MSPPPTGSTYNGKQPTAQAGSRGPIGVFRPDITQLISAIYELQARIYATSEFPYKQLLDMAREVREARGLRGPRPESERTVAPRRGPAGRSTPK